MAAWPEQQGLVAVQSGASGVVFRDAADPDNLRAIKVIAMSPASYKEIRALQVLRHPNIVPALEIKEDVEKQSISIIMPFIPTTLLDLLQQSVTGCLTEGRTRNYFLQILSALEYIHDNGFVHKDIKLENILIDEETNHCYLADFGMVEQFDGITYLQDNFGSLHYSAPEIWENLPYRGPEVDVWGLGVTLYLMVTGVFPFGGTTPAEVAAEILEYDIWFPAELNRDLQDLILKMLARNIRTRISLQEIREHPWIIKGIRNRMLGFGAQAAAVISSSFSPMDRETSELFHAAIKAAVSPEILASTPAPTKSGSRREKKKQTRSYIAPRLEQKAISAELAPRSSSGASNLDASSTDSISASLARRKSRRKSSSSDKKSSTSASPSRRSSTLKSSERSHKSSKSSSRRRDHSQPQNNQTVQSVVPLPLRIDSDRHGGSGLNR